jgi:hypothetical protein
VALPKIHKQPKGHEPEILRAHAHLYRAVIIQPSKRLIVAYSAVVFFAPSYSL